MPPYIAFKHNCRRLHPINFYPPDYAPPKTNFLSTFRTEIRDKLVGTRWDPRRFAPSGLNGPSPSLNGEDGSSSLKATSTEQPEKKPEKKWEKRLEYPKRLYIRLRAKHQASGAGTVTDRCDDLNLARAMRTSSHPLNVAGDARPPCQDHHSIQQLACAPSHSAGISKLPNVEELPRNGVHNGLIVSSDLSSDVALSSPEAPAQFTADSSTSLEKLQVATKEKDLGPTDILAEALFPLANDYFSSQPNPTAISSLLTPDGEIIRNENYIWNPVKPCCGGCSKRFENTAAEVAYECFFPCCELRVCFDCAQFLTLNQNEGGFWGDVVELRTYCAIQRLAEKGDLEAKVDEDREARRRKGSVLLERIRKCQAERREFSDRWIDPNNWGPGFPHYDTKWHY